VGRARSSSIATGGLPDPRALIRAAALAALGAGGAAAQDCTPRLAVVEAGSESLRATFTAPCAPYAAVTVTHGPLKFGEQTGRDGDLRLDLPALPAGGRLTVSLAGTLTRADLPMPAKPVPDLAAVIWPDALPPDGPGARVAESGLGSGLWSGPGSGHAAAPRRLGFPGERPQVDVLPAGATSLDLPITPDTCGQEVTAQVVTGTQTRDLRVTLPACDGPTGALRIPLAP